MSQTRLIVAIAALLCAASAAGAAQTPAGPCAGFKWDVSKEVALFGGKSEILTAGISATSSPDVRAERLYELKLTAQESVAFAVAPGKKTGGVYAGMAALQLDAPGRYRVSLDEPAWVDMAANGKLAETLDFQGQKTCHAPHKIVEFDLSGATKFVLQVSGAAENTIRLTVTRSSRATAQTDPAH